MKLNICFTSIWSSKFYKYFRYFSLHNSAQLSEAQVILWMKPNSVIVCLKLLSVEQRKWTNSSLLFTQWRDCNCRVVTFKRDVYSRMAYTRLRSIGRVAPRVTVTTLVLLQRKLGVYCGRLHVWRLGPDLSIIPPPNIITDQFWIMRSVSREGKISSEFWINILMQRSLKVFKSFVCVCPSSQESSVRRWSFINLTLLITYVVPRFLKESWAEKQKHWII